MWSTLKSHVVSPPWLRINVDYQYIAINAVAEDQLDSEWLFILLLIKDVHFKYETNVYVLHMKTVLFNQLKL